MRIQMLYGHFGSLEAAWHAAREDWQEAAMPPSIIRSWQSTQSKLNPLQMLAHTVEKRVDVLTLLDDGYPQSLRNITDPPPVLYIKGSLLPADEIALAVVGTRKPTRYGREATAIVTKAVAREGVTIVSGMAHGIDAVAHQAALAVGGRTIAVLGCGVDIAYPPEHAELAYAISQQGAVISEFPLGTRPRGVHFPRRNRIISGLSLGVLLGEAPMNSGALITTSLALEQGRDVFAIPMNIFNTTGTGNNRLLQEGAKLIMRVEDVLDELAITRTQIAEQQIVADVQATPEDDLERILYARLSHDPVLVDDLVRETGYEAASVVATLTLLELKGLARTAGPMQYCRA